MALFHFVWAGLGAKFGRAEVTMEGLAFPNRPSKESLAPRMSEAEPNKPRGQGGEGLPGYIYEPGGEFRRRREGRRGNGVKNLIGSEAIPNFSEPNPYKMEENLLNNFRATMAVGRLEIQ